MRLDRPVAVTAIAALAMGLLPLQGLALVQAYEQRELAATAAAASLERLPSEVAAPDTTDTDTAPRRRARIEAEREASQDPVYAAFTDRWPAQANARQDVRDPATTRWALLIGINEHSTSVRDNYGSAQDAVDLAEFLVSKGWREDHIVLMTDYDATRDNIVAGMAWLDAKTDKNSVAIFHYSGHSKKWYDQDHDGDGEITDEGLWPSDGKFIVDSEVVSRLAGVDAGRFWISIGACNSEGFNDPGLARAGRLLTFSSKESEKSYEDPSVANSVYGYYFFDEGLLQGFGDVDGNGRLTVEEAFAFHKPRAHTRTEGQSYGNQNAVMIDDLEGDFDFEIPAPPPEPEPEPEDEPQDNGSGSGLLCPVVCNKR